MPVQYITRCGQGSHCLGLSAATFAVRNCLQALEETLWPDIHLLEVSTPRCAWTAWKSSLVHKGWQAPWSRQVGCSLYCHLHVHGVVCNATQDSSLLALQSISGFALHTHSTCNVDSPLAVMLCCAVCAELCSCFVRISQVPCCDAQLSCELIVDFVISSICRDAACWSQTNS